MSITNEDRYDLQTKANDVLGQKEGATLMELLPPVGWADVATKRDLEQLEERMDLRFDGINQRFGGINQAVKTALAEQNSALQTDMRKMLGVLLEAIVSMATLITAILSIVIAIAT